MILIARTTSIRYSTGMRRLVYGAVLFVVVGALLPAQDRLQTYQANFATAVPETKLEILRASELEDAATMGPLYQQAISYVVSNAENLFADTVLRQIAVVAIERIAEGDYGPAAPELWRLFREFEETTARVQLLQVIASVSDDPADMAVEINNFLLTQNNLVRAGAEVDLQVTRATAEALGVLGQPSSFPVLVDAIVVQYPDFVTEAARDSLEALDVNRLDQATQVLRSLDAADKPPVFDLFIGDALLTEEQQLEFARVALIDALAASTVNAGEVAALRDVRVRAATVIREGGYGEASRAAIRHFNETVLEFERGRIPASPLLEAIATLGAMGTSEAAARLTDYLGLLNTYTERDRPYNTQIVLAVIRNLELLGDPAAYNALFLTSILENYPSRVRDAARQAMDALSG